MFIQYVRTFVNGMYKAKVERGIYSSLVYNLRRGKQHQIIHASLQSPRLTPRKYSRLHVLLNLVQPLALVSALFHDLFPFS